MTHDHHDNRYEDEGGIHSRIAALAYDEEWTELPAACVACGGDTFPLGTLGRTTWLRCRYCGIDQRAADA